MTCKACSGSVSPNPRKKPGTKQPDFLCNQDNGPCGVQNGQYWNPTGAWIPTPRAIMQAAIPKGTPMVRATGQDGFVPKAKLGDVVAHSAPTQDEMWKKKGEQMNRSNLGAAVLRAQGPGVDWALIQQVEAWVLTGKTPIEINDDEIDLENIPLN